MSGDMADAIVEKLHDLPADKLAKVAEAVEKRKRQDVSEKH